MKYINKRPAVLLLQDGTIFHGKSDGIEGFATGELCFNTGMTGYQEVFTDPSYYGQLMITTNAHIGNYGVHNDEVESDGMKISGLICKNFNLGYSRVGADSDLQSYFECQNKENILAESQYGINFASIIGKENIYGVQFHPEKSSSQGLNLIKNFLIN